ncbi:MAG: rod shape-determining protein RodA [Candidatus Nanopelagicales bacterium]|nr:rod shape-determining protein RodA [Candidatus Nanopelagicales bacterium]
MTARRFIGGRAEDKQSYWRRVDWWLVIPAAFLSLASSVFVWSASRADLAPADDPQYFLVRHLINVTIGVGLAFVVSRFNFRLLRAYTPIVYVVSILGILAVYSPIGLSIAGARAWISVPGGFTLQPSELAKVAIVLGLALVLAEKLDAESEPSDRDVLIALGLAALPIGLVLLQNDTGTALVMSVIVLTMISVSGAKRRWIIGLIGGGILAAVVAVQFGVLRDYQILRLTSFLDPEGESGAAAYNGIQARIAIGNGGMFGRGLFEGPQTQGNFVPVNESDFIFTVIGEEAGFIGAVICIALLAIIMWRGLRIALNADDLFGRLVATGVLAWLMFQTFENLGMAMGIMPITGVPLPFVSYGGTSMFASWIALGLLVNVNVHTQAKL